VLTPVGRREFPTWFTRKSRKMLMDIMAITFERISVRMTSSYQPWELVKEIKRRKKSEKKIRVYFPW
jgi:hypothetical protein